jgi:hypothetical protein
MSNVLKNAAESTVHAISDLVDEARDRIDDLPSMTLGHRKSNNRRWMLIAIAGVVGILALVASKRRCRDTNTDSSASAHLAEKSLAVS